MKSSNSHRISIMYKLKCLAFINVSKTINKNYKPRRIMNFILLLLYKAQEIFNNPCPSPKKLDLVLGCCVFFLLMRIKLLFIYMNKKDSEKWNKWVTRISRLTLENPVNFSQRRKRKSSSSFAFPFEVQQTTKCLEF